jgi:hypothetical protein
VSGLRHQQSPTHSDSGFAGRIDTDKQRAVCGCCDTEVAPAASSAPQTGTSELPDGTSSGAPYGLPNGVRSRPFATAGNFGVAAQVGGVSASERHPLDQVLATVACQGTARTGHLRSKS